MKILLGSFFSFKRKPGQENRISEVISRISSIVSEVLSGCEDDAVLSREVVFISCSFISDSSLLFKPRNMIIRKISNTNLDFLKYAFICFKNEKYMKTVQPAVSTVQFKAFFDIFISADDKQGLPFLEGRIRIDIRHQTFRLPDGNDVDFAFSAQIQINQ